MALVVCDRASKLIVLTRLDNTDVPVVDPAVFVTLRVGVLPDIRTQRWDDAFGFRPATARELAAYDGVQDVRIPNLLTAIDGAATDVLSSPSMVTFLLALKKLYQ